MPKKTSIEICHLIQQPDGNHQLILKGRLARKFRRAHKCLEEELGRTVTPTHALVIMMDEMIRLLEADMKLDNETSRG